MPLDTQRRSTSFSTPVIKLRELLNRDQKELATLSRAMSHITTELDTGALRNSVIRFDLSSYSEPQEKITAQKKLQELLQELHPQTDCRRGRGLFIDPENDGDNIILMSYHLHRTTTVPQTLDAFADSVKTFLEEKTFDSLKDFYFQALGRDVKKYMMDNKEALNERGVNQENIDNTFKMLRIMAKKGDVGEQYYQALLSADILMQQGELVAPVEPMRDFWEYALNAGVPMGKPQETSGKTPTFSSVISVPGYNSVEHLHPAYGAQMALNLDKFISSVRKTAAKSKSVRPVIIDAGPCTGTILVPTAEMFPDCDFIAVEPDEPSCQILRQAIKERGISNIRVIQKCMQNISLKDDLDGKKIHGFYSSFAAHHMPLPEVLSKLNEIGEHRVRVLITDEWTNNLGNEAMVRKELMKYHLPIILERCNLVSKTDFDELRKSVSKGGSTVTAEEIDLIQDFNRDVHMLFDKVCNNRDEEADQLLEKMKSYNERYANIFEKKAATNDRNPLHPQVAILLFGIQEFSALHQGAIHYSEEHKGALASFIAMADRDYGYKVKGTDEVMGVNPPDSGDKSGIHSTILRGNKEAKKLTDMNDLGVSASKRVHVQH